MKKSGDLNEFERRLGEIIVECAEIADSAKLAAAKAEIEKYKVWTLALYNEVDDPDKFCALEDCYNYSVAKKFCFKCDSRFCKIHFHPFKSILTGAVYLFCTECQAATVDGKWKFVRVPSEIENKNEEER